MSKNPAPSRSSSINNILRYYWLAIGGIILYIVLDAILQLLPPHYSPIRDAESDLGVGPYGFLMSINFVNRGLLSISFVYALSKTAKLNNKRDSFKSGNALFIVWAVGSVALAFFPTDVPATPMSWHGAIHFILAIIAFVAAAFGPLVLSRHLGEFKATSGIKKMATTLAALVVLFWAAEFAAPFVFHHFANNYGGLLERLFLGSVLLWIFAVSAYVLRNKSTLVQAGSEEQSGSPEFIRNK